MYVVAAEYYTREGMEKEIIDILKKMIPLIARGTRLQALHGEPVAGGPA